MHIKQYSTPPKLHIDPEKWWLEDYTSYWGPVAFEGRVVKLQVG